MLVHQWVPFPVVSCNSHIVKVFAAEKLTLKALKPNFWREMMGCHMPGISSNKGTFDAIKAHRPLILAPDPDLPLPILVFQSPIEEESNSGSDHGLKE